MKSPRVLIVSILLLSLTMTACSEENAETPSDNESVATEESPQNVVGHVEVPCKVRISVAGAANTSFKATGSARVTDDDTAVYSVENDGLRVVLYSEDAQGGASANVGQGRQGWATKANGPKGLQVDPEGTKAVASQLVIEGSGDDGPVTLDARFSCDRAGQ